MPKRKKSKAAAALFARQRKKVGEFIRQRRHELGLSQRDLVIALGYKSAVSISDVEIGRTRVPFRRMYQYADVLQVPRAEFVGFVVGELQGRPAASARPPRIRDKRARGLSSAEQDLLDSFRRLPSAKRNSVRKHIRDLLVPRGGRRAGERKRRRASSRRRA
jgi:transcriptional regulator with XRE-family HTH domain